MASIMVNKDGAGTMIDILPYIRVRLGYPPSDQNRDSALAMLAEDAVGKYSEIAPYIPTHYTFTTVENQASYNLPNDLKTITDIYTPSQYGYYNDTLFLPMIDTPSSSLFGYSDYAFRSPSERVIRQGILGELDHYATGFVGYKVEVTPPPPKIYLFPKTVASNLNVIVRYTADHPNQSSDPLNPSWNTLPPGHWRHVITLVMWAVMQQRSMMLLSTLNATEGGNKAGMVQSWQTMNTAERLLDGVRKAVGADVTVAIRS